MTDPKINEVVKGIYDLVAHLSLQVYTEGASWEYGSATAEELNKNQDQLIRDHIKDIYVDVVQEDPELFLNFLINRKKTRVDTGTKPDILSLKKILEKRVQDSPVLKGRVTFEVVEHVRKFDENDPLIRWARTLGYSAPSELL